MFSFSRPALAVAARPGRRRWLAGLTLMMAGLAGTAIAPSAALAAESGEAQLQSFVSDVRGATGRFEQTTLNPQGQVIQQQSGEFAFARPGRFRWDVQVPFEQLIVSDGQQVVQYDPDLAQATIRPVSDAVGNAPAQVLFGDGDIDAVFRLEPRPPAEGLAWLRATPRSAEAGFAHLDIGLADGLPRRVDILDAFGQTTRIEFVSLVPGGQTPADAFTFQVPEGVDVVRMH
ncbi:MAG: outer membrane lipoprotein chaperone LolA [Pigmentiphaga sp.]